VGWLKSILFALGFLAVTTSLAVADSASSLDGDWDGTLQIHAIKLRMALHIETVAGARTGTLKSIDQGGAVIAMSDIRLDGDKVSFALSQAGASYEGTLAAGGQSMSGTFTQRGNGLPLAFTRRAAGAGELVLNRPQTPHPPYPYRTEDVTFDGAGGVKLAGTLTMPENGAAFAAVILVAGSGPHDRDETIFGHKPFLLLADYLTRHGIAVLRSDKRGIGKSTGDYRTATSEDFASDTESAVAYLKTRSEIDPKKIGLLGHSEGGLIAPIVAAKDHSVAFIVLMAGPGLRGDEILVAQRRLIAEAMGASADQLASGDALQRKIVDAAGQPGSDEEAKARVRAILAEAEPQAPAAAIDGQAAAVTSPWFRFFLTYDPVPTLKQVQCPVLALNGSKDLQVPPKEDLAAIKKAVPDATTVELPGLNHLFQTAKTGSPSEYGDIEETIAPAALETITTWVVKHTK
jgi:pimeloyl-ACP methyl ester carboxylesterase